MEFDAKKFVSEKIDELKKEVNDKKVICATSGGVDSMACALLGYKAIEGNLEVVFIDDGLMRTQDQETVINVLKDSGINAQAFDHSQEFFEALKGITDPEEKRKAFRNKFYEVFGRIVKESNSSFLLQGTIAADILETEGGVKTQHNILEQIGIDPEQNYGFKVLEPLKDIYKPQVREVAKELGLPEDVSERMPFPGPGLATRVLGEVTPERVENLRKATKIVEEEIKISGLKPFQAFAVLLSDRATGVTPDKKRTFGNIVVVRSVESKDAVTAEVTEVPFETLKKIQSRIITEVPEITRVLFDLTPKPPSTIEYI